MKAQLLATTALHHVHCHRFAWPHLAEDWSPRLQRALRNTRR